MEIITLSILFEGDGMKFYIYPAVIKTQEELILVDTGYPMFLPILEDAFRENDLDMQKLSTVVLTHHDHDHMGAVKALVGKYPDVRVVCSEVQMPYVLGQKKSLRLTDAENKGADEDFIRMIKSVEYLDQVQPLNDRDSIAGGVLAIVTSGHMPGHLSVYVEPEKTLISGDVLVVEDGKLAIASEQFVLDKEKEIEALKEIRELDIEKVICFHGGEYASENMKEDLAGIIAKGYN